MRVLSGNEKKDLISLYNKNDKSPEDVNDVIAVYNKICSVESAKNEIKKYTDRANESLLRIESAQQQARLKDFSDMLLNRNY